MSPVCRSRAPFCAAAGAALLLAAAVPARAVVYSWQPAGAGTYSWTATANWNPNSGVPNATDDAADFAAVNPSGDMTVALNGNQTVNSLLLGDADLGTPAGWTIAAGSPAGALTLAGAAPTITVNALAAGKSAAIAAVVAGTADWRKDGPGTLVLSAANAFRGNLLIQGGKLAVAADNRLGDAANALTLDGGTLEMSGGFATARGWTLNSNSANGIHVTTGGVGRLTGRLQGSGGFAKAGTATLALGGGAADVLANTYAGATALTAGSLVFDKAVGVNAVGGDLVISGGTAEPARSHQLPDTASISVSGNGALNFHDGSTGFSETIGSLAIAGGVVATSVASSDNDIAVLGALSVSSGSLTVSRGTVFSANAMQVSGGNVTVQAGDDTRPTELRVGSGGLSFAGASIVVDRGPWNAGKLVLGGNVTTSPAAAVAEIKLGTGSSGTCWVDLGAAGRTFTVADGEATSDFRISLPIMGGPVAGDAIVKEGPGMMELATATNSFNGQITVRAGTLDFKSDGNLGPTANKVVLDGGTLRYSSTTADYNSNGRQFEIASGGGTFEVARAMVFDDANCISGSGTLTKTGAATLLVSQPQAGFAGPVVVAAGTLQLTAAVLPNAGPFTVAAGTLQVGVGSAAGSIQGNVANHGTLIFNRTGTTDVGNIAGTGTTTLTTASSLTATANHVRQNALDLAAGATMKINANAGPGNKAAGVSVLTSTLAAPNNALRIAANATLDLTNNDLVVYYPPGTGAATLANLQQYIYNGYLGATGVPRIAFSADATVGSSVYQTYAVAFDNAALTTPWATWDGQTLSGNNQIIVKYTFRGDADLNGAVDGNDFTVIQQNFGATGLGLGRGWMKGDADLDGDVDGNDFTIIQQNFGAGSGGPLAPPGNAVPEPSTLALALLAALSALGLRRRRSVDR